MFVLLDNIITYICRERNKIFILLRSIKDKFSAFKNRITSLFNKKDTELP